MSWLKFTEKQCFSSKDIPNIIFFFFLNNLKFFLFLFIFQKAHDLPFVILYKSGTNIVIKTFEILNLGYKMLGRFYLEFPFA